MALTACMGGMNVLTHDIGQGHGSKELQLKVGLTLMLHAEALSSLFSSVLHL